MPSPSCAARIFDSSLSLSLQRSVISTHHRLAPAPRRTAHFFACKTDTTSPCSPRTLRHWHNRPAPPSHATHWRTARGGIRPFAASSVACHGHLDPPKPGEERKITFIDKDGESHTFEVADGDNLLDVAQANDIEMEGACGGSCACSTCHVIVDSDEMYDKMAEPEDDENDMLDLAFGLTETSRLGCQVKMSKELDGLVVRLPSMTRNLQASDFVEKEKKS